MSSARGMRMGIKEGVVMYAFVFAVSAALMLYASSSSITASGTYLRKDILVLLSVFLMVVSLHPIAHLVAGRLFGVRFRYFFLDGPLGFQPTLRSDSNTYKGLSRVRKSVFHLSGIAATFVAILSGYFTAILSGAAVAVLVLKALLAVNTILEFSPPLLVKLGFGNFRKSDFYRFWSLWRD